MGGGKKPFNDHVIFHIAAALAILRGNDVEGIGCIREQRNTNHTGTLCRGGAGIGTISTTAACSDHFLISSPGTAFRSSLPSFAMVSFGRPRLEKP